MKLSTLTQRTELRDAEQRHDIAAPAAVVAVVLAIVLMFGGHSMVALAALAAGGFVYWSTAAEVRAEGDPDAMEEFYRLADPNRPLELPQPAPPPVLSSDD